MIDDGVATSQHCHTNPVSKRMQSVQLVSKLISLLITLVSKVFGTFFPTYSYNLLFLTHYFLKTSNMPTYQLHLEGQEHGKNCDFHAQGETVITIG